MKFYFPKKRFKAGLHWNGKHYLPNVEYEITRELVENVMKSFDNMTFYEKRKYLISFIRDDLGAEIIK